MPKIEKVYTIFKGIKLTEAQAAAWDSQAVKDFLSGTSNGGSPLPMALLRKMVMVFVEHDIEMELEPQEAHLVEQIYMEAQE